MIVIVPVILIRLIVFTTGAINVIIAFFLRLFSLDHLLLDIVRAFDHELVVRPGQGRFHFSLDLFHRIESIRELGQV